MLKFLGSIFRNNKTDRPNLRDSLFWEWDLDKVNWRKMYLAVIDRVIERGDKVEWNEMIRYYGRPKVLKALKKQIKYLPDYAIEDVCNYFDLKREELACYERTQSQKGHWI